MQRNRKNTDNSYGKELSQMVVYNKTTLPNGLRIITEETPSVESFALGITINVGSREDPQHLSGISHFIEHALFRRTKTRNTRQIAVQFESLGAEFNAYTTKETTCLYARALKQHFKKSLQLLADIMMNPVFAGKDIKNERSVILEEISIIEDDPEELIFDYGDKFMFGNHPLSNPILGVKETVESIEIDDLYSFYKKNYTPGNVVITAAGNIPHENIVPEIAALFGEFNGSGSVSRRVNPYETIPLRQEFSKQFQQTHILIGRRVEGINSKDSIPLSIFNILFGDGMSSRLHQQLREKQGLAYNIYSSLPLMSDCGQFYIYSSSDMKKAAKLERLALHEISRVFDDRITKVEIERAKEQLKTATIIELESMSARMQSLAKNELFRGGHVDLSSAIAEIEAITIEEINRVVEKYFSSNGWNIVVFNP